MPAQALLTLMYAVRLLFNNLLSQIISRRVLRLPPGRVTLGNLSMQITCATVCVCGPAHRAPPLHAAAAPAARPGSRALARAACAAPPRVAASSAASPTPPRRQVAGHLANYASGVPLPLVRYEWIIHFLCSVFLPLSALALRAAVSPLQAIWLLYTPVGVLMNASARSPAPPGLRRHAPRCTAARADVRTTRRAPQMAMSVGLLEFSVRRERHERREWARAQHEWLTTKKLV